MLSHSVVSDSLQVHGLEPTRLICPWDFPGKKHWSGLTFLSLGDLPDQGIQCEFLHRQVDSLPLLHVGSHYIEILPSKDCFKS